MRMLQQCGREAIREAAEALAQRGRRLVEEAAQGGRIGEPWGAREVLEDPVGAREIRGFNAGEAEDDGIENREETLRHRVVGPYPHVPQRMAEVVAQVQQCDTFLEEVDPPEVRLGLVCKVDFEISGFPTHGTLTSLFVK